MEKMLDAHKGKKLKLNQKQGFAMSIIERSVSKDVSCKRKTFLKDNDLLLVRYKPEISKGLDQVCLLQKLFI